MNILKQPYPYYFQNKRMVKIAGFIFAVVFIFLVIFKPFNIEETEHRFPYIITSLIQSFCSALVFILVLFTFNFWVNEKVEEHWTVIKEIGLLASVFFCIGVGNFLLRNVIYNNPNNFSFYYFFEEVSHTFLIGVLLTIIFTLTNTERLTRFHKRFAAEVTKEVKEASQTQPNIFIETKNEKERIELSLHQFLFAKADGNYVEFYLFKEGKLHKKLCRITLTQVEEQLKNIPTLLRTHRTYLVNTNHIQKIEGNAQGLQLYIETVPEIIPVSRGQIAAFKNVMNS